MDKADLMNIQHLSCATACLVGSGLLLRPNNMWRVGLLLRHLKPARSNQLQPNPDLGLVGVRLELVGFGWSGAIVGYRRNVAGWSALGLVGAAGIYACVSRTSWAWVGIQHQLHV